MGFMTGRPDADFDCIVVGAGHNGLIAAAYLARHGFATLLVEARATVGGAASSETYMGATVNICNCDHLSFRSTPVAEELGLFEHGLSYIDMDPAQVNGDWSSRRFWSIHHDLDRTLESLAVAHPTAVDGYRNYARTMMPVARLILNAGSMPPTKRNLIGAMARQGGRGVATMLRMSRMSAADVMRDFIDCDEVISPAMVEGPVVWGLSPETPGTGLGALGYALRHVATVGRPEGGSGALPQSVLASFLEAGGLLRTGVKVTGILCEGSRVSAVQTSDGATVTARIVVSACDPRQTFVRWLKNPPARANALIDRWRNGHPAEGYESKIDAILTRSPEIRGVNEMDIEQPIASTIVVAPSTAELHRGAQLKAEGRIMPRLALLANCPSVADDTLAAGGDRVFSLEALFTPYSFTGGWPNNVEASRWLDQFSTVAQDGFLDTVKSWRVLTPHEYERDFHMPRGHATSFGGGPLAAFLGRDPELTRYRTPIKGLYLTGAATYPGAGVWGASGRNSALTIIRDLG